MDELGNVDVSDDDGTLVYPEWDDEGTADFPDDDLDVEEPEEELPDEDVSADPESQIVTYGLAEWAAGKEVDRLENLFKEQEGKDPKNIDIGTLTDITAEYKTTKAVVDNLKKSNDKTKLQNRLKVLEPRYNAYSTELTQRECITAADAALNKVENAIQKDEADPGSLDEGKLLTVVGLYNGAAEAIKKVNDDQPKKADLVSRLKKAKAGVDRL